MAEETRRIPIRNNHYYGGDLTLSLGDPTQIDEKYYFLLEWRAYEGGSVTLRLDRDELQNLLDAGIVLMEDQARELPWVVENRG